MTLTEVLNLFQLFSFVPTVGVSAVFWFERHRRAGLQKRTSYLLVSLVFVVAVGLVQAAAWVFRPAAPLAWPQVFVASGLLYFLALFFLEYAIHVKRIEESFLTTDFRKEVLRLALALGAAALVGVAVLVGGLLWQGDHTVFPLNLLLDEQQQRDPLLGYTQHMRLLTLVFALVLVVALVLAAKKVFDLQEGVIRRRGYPFYAQILVTVVLVVAILRAPVAARVEDSWFLPVFWFGLLNLVYLVRLVEEFFFWSQYNLRSDRARMDQRQHTQNLLIRRVIGAADEDDRSVIREVMDAALEKAKGRMVVQEYQMTGMVAYRAVGNLFRVEDLSHIVGYCTPLTDTKAVKNLDKQKLNEHILRTTFDQGEFLETLPESQKDFGKRLVHQALASGQLVVTSELPDGLKGLQRLAAVVPVRDSEAVLGFLVVYKDSFDRLYPGEREILGELAENLATVYALMAGKALQRERNRLQGEMNTARNIQTSILPRHPEVPGYQVATHMETATEVGGDVFDFLPTPYGTYFGIGDVAGHGLPAGMMAVISVAALHGALDASKSLGTALSLDQVYDGVNRVLCTLNRDRIGSDKFMTQNYFLVNEGTVGHVGTHLVGLVWRARSQSVEELGDLINKTGFLGLSEFMPSVQSVGSFTLETDDVLLLYSDGVSEAKNANGTLYGLSGLKGVLANHGQRSAQEVVEAVLEDVRRHASTGDFRKHGGRFADDVSLVVLKRQ